jgi:hypothetical protein
MPRLWIMIEIAVTLLVIVSVAAYWAGKDERAAKDGKPKPRRRIW